MPSLTRTIETDVAIVGAGLVGLAHAHEARRRGLSVVVLERDTRAAGASVRGSGHLFFSALPSGAPLDAARLARRRWLDLAGRAGVPVEAGGTLIIARHRDELELFEGAAAEQARQARMVSQAEIGALAPIPLDGVLGGFYAPDDLRIDPRSAAAALARLLRRDPNARVEWGINVHEIEPGVVHAGLLRVRAAAIVMCGGAEQQAVSSEKWPAGGGLATTQAQMLRLAAPSGRRYAPTLMDGLSLLAMPAFAESGIEPAFAESGIEKLRERIELETPELIERGARLVVTQNRSGDLIAGSTETYTDASTPFSTERMDELLLRRIEEILGIVPVVRQRWSSSNLSSGDGPGDFLLSSPMQGVRVVQSTSATADAIVHLQAESVLDELLAAGIAGSEDIRVHDVRGQGGTRSPIRDHARAFGNRTPSER